MMLVNNETGCIFPVAEAAKLLRERKSQALLHTDAVQAFLKVPFAAATLGADMISLSAHKLGAPKGIGALYLGPRVNKNAVRSLLAGGGQEGGLRSGTEATAQIAGFAKAVELRRENFEEKLAHMAAIKAYAEEKLLAIDGVERVGNGQAPHVLCISLVGYPSANVVTELGAQGICISAGSACHRGKVSHVYAAMELAKKTAAGVLRISFAPDTTFEEIDALAAALKAHKETRFPML
jgi:cysteine desulfurase